MNKYRKVIHILFYAFFAALIGYGIYTFVSFYFKPNKLVELNTKYITLYEGDAYPLQGEYEKSDGSISKIIYSINNEDIASIDRDTGVVIAKKTGKATLFATVEDDSSIYSEATIKVVKQDMNKNKILVNTPEIKISKNEYKNIYVSIGKTSPERVTYRSKNPEIALVDNNGVVKAIGDGEAEIEVLLDDGEPQIVKIVVGEDETTKKNPDKDKNKKNNPDNKNNKDNKDDNNNNNNNNNKDDNNNNPSFNVGGARTPDGSDEGIEIIGSEIEETPNKKVRVKEITISKQYLNLRKGDSATLKAVIKPSNASNKKVSWTTSNKKIATVDSNGKVTAISAGSAVISVITKDGNKSAVCKVTVKDDKSVTAVEKIVLNRSNYILTTGKSEQATYSVIPSSSSNKNVTWSSSNNKVVSVDANGKLTGVGAGTATITATSNNGITATASVKVYQSGLAVADTYNDTDEYIIYAHNVLEYGANPYGEGDSTKAFKDALAVANNCKSDPNCLGYTVYVPKGKYVIKDTLDLAPAVGLIGDLKKGTADGTVLIIDHHAGNTTPMNAAIRASAQSAIMNIAFYYPNQTVSNNGYNVAYPPTILETGKAGLTLNNVNFINSYTAMDLASYQYNNSEQHLYNIYGSPRVGLINDFNLDTIRITNMYFSPKYWLNSGQSNIPNKATLESALKTSGTGVIFERVDWYLVNGINIDGYNIGIHLRDSTPKGYTSDDVDRNAEGEFYDINITNSNVPMLVESTRHLSISNSKFVTSSNNNAAIEIHKSANITIYNSVISGKNSITNRGSGNISLVANNIKGAINRTGSGKLTFVSNTLSGTLYDNDNVSVSITKLDKVDYNRRITTKPSSKKMVVIKGRNTDVTGELKNAINSLKSTGGIVYFPPGHYQVNAEIKVPAGIEIRGTTPWFHDWLEVDYTGAGYDYATRINTNSKGVLFNMSSNSGLNGFTIIYPSAFPYETKPAIVGNGHHIYVMNLAMPNTWKGLDFASHRCDNHYISNVLGEFFEFGFKVGSDSRDGVVRGCHVTINSLVRVDNEDWRKKWEYIIAHQIAYELGASQNELMVDNLAYNANVGFNIMGTASKYKLLGASSDSSTKYALKIDNTVSSSGYLINPLFVTMTSKLWCHSVGVCFDSKVDPSERNYIVTGAGFDSSSNVKIINPLTWGNVYATAYDLKGTGSVSVYGGSIDEAKGPIFKSATNTNIYGLLVEPSESISFQFDNGAKKVSFVGNICRGNLCSNSIANYANANLGINNSGIK